MEKETSIFNRMITNSTQFSDIKGFISRLHQRGQLVAIYQDFERVLELEKETNKISTKIMNRNESIFEDGNSTNPIAGSK